MASRETERFFPKALFILCATVLLGASSWALSPPSLGSAGPVFDGGEAQGSLGAFDDGGSLVALEFGPQPFNPPIRPSDLSNRAVLLCWHTFLGLDSIDTDFSLNELAAQLDSLIALGYHFVDLVDLLAGRVEGSLNIVATLDDGHRTVPAAVDKVFLPRGIRPAIFIYPAIIGSVPYAMDDAAVKRLSAEGCLIGAHGYHHLYVTADLLKSDPAEFNKEIYKAKYKTEAISGLPVDVYAYPYGAYSPVTVKEIDKAGYSFGIAVKPGYVFSLAALDPPYELPRYVVTRQKWKDIFALLERNARSSRAFLK